MSLPHVGLEGECDLGAQIIHKGLSDPGDRPPCAPPTAGMCTSSPPTSQVPVQRAGLARVSGWVSLTL